VAVGRYREIIATFRYFLIKNREQAGLFNGRTLKLPRQLPGIGRELLLYGVHEPTASKAYQDILKPGEKIFEVGANIGYYISLADAIFSSNVEFLAIELDPEVFETLLENVANIGQRVRTKSIAASDSSGEVIFYRSKSSNLGSLRSHRMANCGKIIVGTSTIDSLCAEFDFSPSVLRMDIEGAEIFALRGAQNVLSRCKPKLFLELHPPFMTTAETIEVMDILRSNGYRDMIVIDRSYDHPSALRFLGRAKPKLLTIDEVQDLTASRHFAALSLISRGTEQ
jgi:FkbM family methyltransferase